MEFETTEIVRISNGGNARAYFQWVSQVQDSKIFKLKTTEGWVDAHDHIDCSIIYLPNQQSGAGKADEEKLTLKVQDGPDLVLQLVGNVSEFRCAFT